MNKKSLAKTVK